MSWRHTKQEEWRCGQCSRVFRVMVERSGTGTWTCLTWVEGHRRQEACEEEDTARRFAKLAMDEHDRRFHTDSLWAAEGQ